MPHVPYIPHPTMPLGMHKCCPALHMRMLAILLPGFVPDMAVADLKTSVLHLTNLGRTHVVKKSEHCVFNDSVPLQVRRYSAYQMLSRDKLRFQDKRLPIATLQTAIDLITMNT